MTRRPVSKPGAHGTLYLYRVSYRAGVETCDGMRATPDPAAPPMYVDVNATENFRKALGAIPGLDVGHLPWDSEHVQQPDGSPTVQPGSSPTVRLLPAAGLCLNPRSFVGTRGRPAPRLHSPSYKAFSTSRLRVSAPGRRLLDSRLAGLYCSQLATQPSLEKCAETHFVLHVSLRCKPAPRLGDGCSRREDWPCGHRRLAARLVSPCPPGLVGSHCSGMSAVPRRRAVGRDAGNYFQKSRVTALHLGETGSGLETIPEISQRATGNVLDGLTHSATLTEEALMSERDFEMESKEHEARAWLWETRCRELAAQVARAASFGALTDHPEARELYAMARYTLAQEKRA